MSILKLILTPIDGSNFSIIANNYGNEESELPFANDAENSHFYTILTAINSLSSQYSSKSNDNQEWMIEEELLTEDRKFFHPQMRQKIGQKLYQALFPGKIEKALNQALGNNQPLHIQIEYDFQVINQSTLSLYPWNLVHDGNDFLAQRKVSFSYRIAHPNSLLSGKRQIDKLKVLVISSKASEKDKDKLENKELLIENSLKKAQEKGRAELLSWYTPTTQKPTFQRLREYLTDYQNEADKLPDIIHFDGHGFFKKQCTNPECPKKDSHEIIYPSHIQRCEFCQTPLNNPQGFLLFEDDEGKANYVSAEQFTRLIRISKPGLVLLTACKSALAYKSNSVFNGVAQKLLQEVPAVVATQFNISADSTTNFIEGFYRVLGNGKSSLLDAVKQAADAMKYHEYEWYRPIIFLRHDGDEDGFLFDFQETQTTLFNQESQELESSDMETLKKILTVSKLASAYKRNNFLSKIGVDNNFAERNIDNYNDEDFVDTLIDYLENTKQIEILINLCQQLESKIKTGDYHRQLQIIKFKLLNYGKI